MVDFGFGCYTKVVDVERSLVMAAHVLCLNFDAAVWLIGEIGKVLVGGELCPICGVCNIGPVPQNKQVPSCPSVELVEPMSRIILTVVSIEVIIYQ